MLERGLIKSIGDGHNTFIWADKWVFDEVPRRPINKETMIDLNLKVAHLMTSQGEWNLHLLNELFPLGDVVRIRLFPPAPNLKDRAVWAFTNDGKYSVKSGNWLASREVAAMTSATGNSDTSSDDE